MWRRLLPVLFLFAVFVPSNAAAADTPGCVSNPEHRATNLGMTRGKVHSITDTKGKVTVNTTRLGRPYQQRIYDRCGTPEAGSLSMWFEKIAGKWRLTDLSFRYALVVASYESGP